MKKQDKKKKPWLSTFEKKWQRVCVVCLLFIFIACMTIVVLLGVEYLFPAKASGQQETSTASAVSTAASSAVIPTTLPETSDAGRSYLDGTLFLGDSNTVRFMAYNDVDNTAYTSTQNTIAVVGMGVNAIDTLSCEELSTGTYTMTEAVPILQPERIIITFGTNNLDGTTTDPTGFITEYTKQLKEIQDAYPSVDIIVNSIPPIAQVNSYPKLKTDQIVIYNTAIEKMCETNDWKYLNSYEALTDTATGYAKTGYLASDGLHLSETGLRTLFTYIRTHAYITEDDRPKPLAEIPEIIGPVVNMYSVNPLNNQQFDNSVYYPTAAPAVQTPAVQSTTTDTTTSTDNTTTNTTTSSTANTVTDSTTNGTGTSTAQTTSDSGAAATAAPTAAATAAPAANSTVSNAVPTTAQP